MSNSLPPFLLDLFPQLQGMDARGVTVNVTPQMHIVSGNDGVDLLPALLAAGARTSLGGGGGAAAGVRGGARGEDGAGVATMAPTGNVYTGDMPPMLWIQREQQRIHEQLSSASGNVAHDEAERLRREGNRAFRASHYAEAVQLYTQAIDVDPAAAVNYTNRSFAYYKLGEYALSARDAEVAIRLSPQFYKAYYRLGLAQLARGEYAQALDNLRKALGHAPAANKDEILVAVAKCESKLARAPATPLIMGCGSSSSNSNSGLHGNGDDGARGEFGANVSRADGNSNSGADDASAAAAAAAAPPDYGKIAELVHAAVQARDAVTAYESVHAAQHDIAECRDRSAQIRQLMSVATSGRLSELTQSAHETQEALRRTLKSESRGVYYAAKQRRDEAYRQLWQAATEVDHAIHKLTSIAQDESSFFGRFTPRKDDADTMTTTTTTTTQTDAGNSSGSNDGDVAVVGGGSRVDDKDYHTHTDAAATTAAAAPAAATTVASDGEGGGGGGVRVDDEAFARLLRRRDEIAHEVQQARRVFRNTDAAARGFRDALDAEQRTMARLRTVLDEAAALNAELERYARAVAQTSSRELTASRLEALDAVRAAVDRVKLDESSFRSSLEEGERLLEREAEIERERLVYERQRIKMQAEVEWLKVRDMPEQKIQVLQNHVAVLQQKIADINAQQQKVQHRILELIHADHPELAWQSLASGSRIISLVKGSGLWLNLSLSDFQVVATLSSTINSKVYHAVRRGEHVALKEISVDSEAARRRFQREVDIVAACVHPNIIRVKGVFFDGPFAYLLMRYYERGSIKALLAKREPLPWGVVQDIFRQLATALAYLHERGVVHGDIKPSNVLLTSDARPVIADFGIAKDLGRFGGLADVTVTNAGVLGTVNYMAPEQLRGTQSSSSSSSSSSPMRGSSDNSNNNNSGGGDDFASAAVAAAAVATGLSDIWALGLTMYELAANNAFFLDPSLGEPTMPVVHATALRVDVAARRVGGDEKLAEVLSSALTVDPSRRSSAYELLAHPYFSTSLGMRFALGVGVDDAHGASSSGSGAAASAASAASSGGGGGNAALTRSDERLEAVRAYIHAVRRGQQRKVLVSVSRNQMVESLQQIFARLDESEMLSPIMVVFQGEPGIDEGALTTEMLNLFYEQMANDKRALVCVATSDGGATTTTAATAAAAAATDGSGHNDGATTTSTAAPTAHTMDMFSSSATYLPAADVQHLPPAMFELLGKVLLKSVIENRPLPLRLNTAIVKHFCGVEPSMLDLEEYDAALSASLKRLPLLSSADLATADIDFSHFSDAFLAAQYDGKYTTTTTVTPDNVRDYVALRVVYDMSATRAAALAAMTRGFFSVRSLDHHLRLLTPSDLLLLLCGVQHISPQLVVDALDFQGFASSSNTPQYLKQTLLAMSQNNLRRFLLLCTAAAALPASNTLRKIKVVRGGDLQRLPVGHGCVSQLDLPDYNDAQMLKEKLDLALAHVSDGFHIV